MLHSFQQKISNRLKKEEVVSINTNIKHNVVSILRLNIIKNIDKVYSFWKLFCSVDSAKVYIQDLFLYIQLYWNYKHSPYIFVLSSLMNTNMLDVNECFDFLFISKLILDFF